MQDETKRLVLADDHHLLRRGFRSLLSDEPGLEVVGEASTGLEAIETCRRLAPDLVLMDSVCLRWTASRRPARSNASSPA